MPFRSASIPALAPLGRAMAAAFLLGAVGLVSPLTPAWGQNAQPPGAMGGETIEQRIAGLHAQLQITPAQEAAWGAVARTMRDNAAVMQRLLQEKEISSRQGLTAVQDLQNYEEFTRVQLEGLRTLIASFQTLYNSMPAGQKRIADQVFQAPQQQGQPNVR